MRRLHRSRAYHRNQEASECLYRSDLEVVLRSLGIKHLLLSGIATSGWYYLPCVKQRTGIMQ